MELPPVEVHREMGMSHIRYAKEEIERRKTSPVLVPAEQVEAQFKVHNHPYIVDPRLGFNQRTFRFWINRVPLGGEMEGGGWKTLGHRHTVEAVIYLLQGHGHSVIDGVKHPWQAGDLICVPVFAWHRHVNESDQDLIYVAATTGPYAMAMGTAVHEDERFPEHWVYADKGEDAQRSLIPGSIENPGDKVEFDTSRWRPRENLNGGVPTPAELYYQQLTFAADEEKRRRAGRVVIPGSELRFGPTPMGRVAYAVDPRLGFHVKLLSTLIAEVPAGKRSGAHRHLYEETNYVLTGEGYVIIDDRKYDFKQGDALVIPVFAWHQYFNTGSETVRLLVHSSRVHMESTGYLHTQQGEAANYE